MKKHAYLIKAHHQFELLKKLLQLLDDERNDIYLHISLKSTCDLDDLKSVVKKSSLYFTERIRESWGGYSQIKSELILFQNAYGKKYEYYHLISGADLPLKTQDQIHDFFCENSGKEFIYFCPEEFLENSKHKYEQYHILQEKVGFRKEGIVYFLERVSLFLQRKLGIRRGKKEIEYRLGANWMSITHDLVGFILSHEKLIEELFRTTCCCDEFFVQTLVWNSEEYREKVFSFADNYFACLRMIDWKRGMPYVWRIEDYDELILAPHLFARKFDETVDKEIIDRIFNYVRKS